MHHSLRRSLETGLLLMLITVFGDAGANVPIDSFNSANAALNPAVAVKRDSAEHAMAGGPAAALARFARQKSGSVQAPASAEAEKTSQHTPENQPDNPEPQVR